MRQLSQRVLGVTHSNFESGVHRQSTAITAGYVGPLPLIKMSDMVGFDDMSKPGPSQRTEQLTTGNATMLDFPNKEAPQCFSFSPNRGSMYHIFHFGGQLRKGLPVHAGIIDGIVDGMNIKPEDRVVFVDIIPNWRGALWMEASCFFVVSIHWRLCALHVYLLFVQISF